MNSFYKIAFTGLFIIYSISIFSQPKYRLTVNELFEKGIENSLAVQSTQVKLQISQDKQILARNRRLPDLQASGLFGYVGQSTVLDKDLSAVAHPKAPDWKQNYQITAVQPIYQGGRIKNNIKKSDLDTELSQLYLIRDKSDLKLWLIDKYLNLYDLYKQNDTYSINIDEAKIRLKNIEKMKEEGMITSNDVLRTQIQLTDYELSYQEVNNNIALLSQQLAIALGMNEDLIFEPDSSLINNLQDNTQTIQEYIETAYQSYPNMKIAKTNIDVARNNLKILKADYLPALSLQAGNTFQRPIPGSSPVQDMYVNAWGLTLNLSYKISALFDRKHSISSAKSQILLQDLAEEQQKQNIRTSVKAYYLKHQEALNRVKSLEKSVEQANENYRIVNKKYFNQLAILTDLLDANAVQLNAQLKLTAAKTNAIYTYYQLLNICGKL